MEIPAIHDTYKENPFLSKITMKDGEKIDKVANTNLRLVDEAGNPVETESKIVYAKETHYDRTTFIKFYCGQWNILTRLSKSGIRLLVYIVDHRLRHNRDDLILVMDDFVEKTGDNKSGFYKAVSELITEKVIAKQVTAGCYWINPAILYKGERKYLFFNQ